MDYPNGAVGIAMGLYEKVWDTSRYPKPPNLKY